MNKENDVKKCKKCGATLVGKNKVIDLCSNCTRNIGQGGLGILAGVTLVGSVVLGFVKLVLKRGR